MMPHHPKGKGIWDGRKKLTILPSLAKPSVRPSVLSSSSLSPLRRLPPSLWMWSFRFHLQFCWTFLAPFIRSCKASGQKVDKVVLLEVERIGLWGEAGEEREEKVRRDKEGRRWNHSEEKVQPPDWPELDSSGREQIQDAILSFKVTFSSL